MWSFRALNAALIVVGALLFGAGEAVAASGAAVTLPTQQALADGFFGQAGSIIITDRLSAGDSGGGTYGIGAAGCTPNGGTILRDLALNCFYLKSSSPITVEMFGALPCNGSSGDCGNGPANTDAFTAAMNAAAAFGRQEVVVAGAALGKRYYVTNLDIIQNINLVCPYGIAYQGETGNTYTGNFNLIPYTILVPHSTMTMANNSRTSGCTFMQSGLAVPTAGPTTIAQLYTTSANMTGVGIEIIGRRVIIENTQIIGFQTGIFSHGANQTDMRLQNLTIDSHRCIYLRGTRLGNGWVNNIRCNPIPRAMAITNYSMNISAMTDIGAAGTRITLDTVQPSSPVPDLGPCATASGKCPQVGWTVWLAEMSGGASTVGRFPVTAIGTSGGNTTTFDIPAPFTNPTTTGDLTINSPVVTNLVVNTTNITQVAEGTVYFTASQGSSKRIRLTVGSTLNLLDGQYICILGVDDSGDQDIETANDCGIVDVITTAAPGTLELLNSEFIEDCLTANGCTPGGNVTWGYPVANQSVTHASLPANTYIKAVWPRYNTMLLSASPTATATTQTLVVANLPFLLTVASATNCVDSPTTEVCLTLSPLNATRGLVEDGAISPLVVSGVGCGANGRWSNIEIESDGTVRLESSTKSGGCAAGTAYMGYVYLQGTMRTADALYLEDTNNILVNNFSTYQHENGITFGPGTAFTNVNGIDINQQNDGWDRLWCGLKFRVQAKGNTVSGGSLQVGSGQICADFDSNTSVAMNRVRDLSLGGSEHAGPYGTHFRIGGDKGAITLSDLGGTPVGWAFIGSGAGQRFRLDNVVLPAAQLYYGSETQQLVQYGQGNQFNNTQPNKVTLGNCATDISRTTLEMPFYNCGLAGMAKETLALTAIVNDGTRATAQAVTLPVTQLNTIPDNGDGVLLTVADGSGKCQVIFNNTNNRYAQVFAQGSDTINGVAGVTGVPIGAGLWLTYCTYTDDAWIAAPSALQSGSLANTYNTDNTDADWTWTPLISPQTVRVTTVLTANRAITLSPTNAVTGMRARFFIDGTTTGFTWNLGGLTTLGKHEWAEVMWNGDGPAWLLVQRGSLKSPYQYETKTNTTDWTWTPFNDLQNIVMTGTIAANRVVTLATTNAPSGMLARFTVTGTTAEFNWSIGGLTTLTTNQWAEVIWNGSAWVLSTRGNLALQKTIGGVTTVTGTADVTTGLNTVTSCSATPAADASMNTAWATISIPTQTGGTAGHVTVKAWKPTAAGDVTPIASSTATSIAWICYGT